MTEANRGVRDRPTSPHTQVWRWHITMATSILHRATGVGLYIGGLIAAWWAIALAQGPEAYAQFKGAMGSLPGKVVMFGLTVAFFFHLANGVRHLVWDSGHAFDLRSANASSVMIFAFTAAATLATWYIAAITGAL